MEASRGHQAIANAPLQPVVVKSKTTAVLLAVFLGLWTWLYTYKVDSWKFWVSLGLSVVTIGIFGLIAWLWALINAATRPGEWYETFPNGDVLAKQDQLERGQALQESLVRGTPQNPGFSSGVDEEEVVVVRKSSESS